MAQSSGKIDKQTILAKLAELCGLVASMETAASPPIQAAEPAPAAAPTIILSEESQKLKKDKATKRLFEFFEEKGYHILSLKKRQEIPANYSKLADLLVKNHKLFYNFIGCLLNKNNDAYSLEADDKESVSRIVNLCSLLKKREWIDYKYVKQEKKITFSRTSSFKGEIKQFLSGVYGEFGAGKIIEQALKDYTAINGELKYQLFYDVKLKRPDSKNSNDMQLDLVVELPEGFYIFETKMGIALAIDKWVDRTRLFASDKNRFITCCADETLNARIFTPYILFNVNKLKEQMTALLKKDYPASETK